VTDKYENMKFTKFPKISYLVFPVREDIFFVKCSLFLSKLKLIYIISMCFLFCLILILSNVFQNCPSIILKQTIFELYFFYESITAKIELCMYKLK
jgi:hypothetical protein